MNYIVFDLEWNQSPKGKEGAIDHFPFEIIEIGAVKLDEDRNQIGEFQQLISPTVYTQIHYKISEVTHMDMETLRREGIPFEKAMKHFLQWCGKDYRFVTWGSMDLTELQRNMVYYGLEIPFPMPLLYYDLQKLYSILYHDGKEKLSLDQAVENLEIPIDEKKPFHHALDDAFYTGQIMSRMDFAPVKEFFSMDYYRLPETDEEQVMLSFPGYTKFVSKEFLIKEEALSNKRVSEVMCCLCRRILRKKIRWFAVNSKLYVCLAVCPEHGLIRSKIRIKKSESGCVFVVRTARLADDKEAEAIAEKRNEVKKRRIEKNKLKKKSIV
ncbi:MAG: exonuclease domain-containing protein [Lachnospiraceae bacterium]|jgi:DNA polymerase III epsilon subunit-like protein|nr:exonuclease domain-containing protein [Lachnospiraceae bacterium]